MDGRARADGPDLSSAVCGVRGKFAGPFALENQIAGSGENAAVGGDRLLHYPTRGFAHRVPCQKFSFFRKLIRSQTVRFDIVNWKINQASQRTVAHGPPVVSAAERQASFPSGKFHSSPGCDVKGSSPTHFRDGLPGEKLTGGGIQHIEEPVLRRRHRNMTLLAAYHDVGHKHMHVLVVKVLRTGLVMPTVFSGVCVYCNYASRKQPIATHFHVGFVAEEHLWCGAGGSEKQKSSDWIIRDRVPNVAASNLPPFIAGPGFCGHLERLRFEALGRISGHRPESPSLLARFGVESNHRSADANVGAVIADEHLALGDMRRASNPSLASVAYWRLPSFFPRRSIYCDQAAIACANVDLACPNRQPAIRARRP